MISTDQHFNDDRRCQDSNKYGVLILFFSFNEAHNLFSRTYVTCLEVIHQRYHEQYIVIITNTIIKALSHLPGTSLLSSTFPLTHSPKAVVVVDVVIILVLVLLICQNNKEKNVIRGDDPILVNMLNGDDLILVNMLNGSKIEKANI